MSAHTEIRWNRDYEAAQPESADSGRPLLLDFSAAPM